MDLCKQQENKQQENKQQENKQQEKLLRDVVDEYNTLWNSYYTMYGDTNNFVIVYEIEDEIIYLLDQCAETALQSALLKGASDGGKIYTSGIFLRMIWFSINKFDFIKHVLHNRGIMFFVTESKFL